MPKPPHNPGGSKGQAKFHTGTTTRHQAVGEETLDPNHTDRSTPDPKKWHKLLVAHSGNRILPNQRPSDPGPDRRQNPSSPGTKYEKFDPRRVNQPPSAGRGRPSYLAKECFKLRQIFRMSKWTSTPKQSDPYGVVQLKVNTCPGWRVIPRRTSSARNRPVSDSSMKRSKLFCASFPDMELLNVGSVGLRPLYERCKNWFSLGICNSIVLCLKSLPTNQLAQSLMRRYPWKLNVALVTFREMLPKVLPEVTVLWRHTWTPTFPPITGQAPRYPHKT